MRTENFYYDPIIPSINENLEKIRKISGNSSDLLINEFVTGGVNCVLLCCEGMLSTSTITELVLHPITKINLREPDGQALFNHIQNNLLLSVDRVTVKNYGELFRTVNSGFGS